MGKRDKAFETCVKRSARLSTGTFSVFAGVTLLSSRCTSSSVDEPVGDLTNVSSGSIEDPGSRVFS